MKSPLKQAIELLSGEPSEENVWEAYAILKTLDESAPAPEISFYCRAKDEENYLCEAQCERCAKADKFELPAPEITEYWILGIIHEHCPDIYKKHALVKAIHLAIAEQNHGYEIRIESLLNQCKVRDNELAAKEKEVAELKDTIRRLEKILSDDFDKPLDHQIKL